MKRSKKLLALLLAVVMVLGVMPTASVAAGTRAVEDAGPCDAEARAAGDAPVSGRETAEAELARLTGQSAEALARIDEDEVARAAAERSAAMREKAEARIAGGAAKRDPAPDEDLPYYAAVSWLLEGAQTVYVSDAETLRYYLRDPVTPYNIVLVGNCCTPGHQDYGVWAPVNGIKSLDLNGNTIYVNNNVPAESTMFSVNEDAVLELYDSYGGGWINYDGYIHEEGRAQVRNIFDVVGTLIMDSGTVEAGRSKKGWADEEAKNALLLNRRKMWKQVLGYGVRVFEDGTFIMNGGAVYGRGKWTNWSGGGSGYCGVYTNPGSHVYLNGGTVGGFGGGSAFPGHDIPTVRGGYFYGTSHLGFVHTYDQSLFFWGDYIEDESRYGKQYGVTYEPNYGRGCVSSYYLWCRDFHVYPEGLVELTREMASLTPANPTLSIEPEYYYEELRSVYRPGAKDAFDTHENMLRYTWEVYDGQRWIVSDLHVSNEINVKTAWASQGFVPEAGKRYEARGLMQEVNNGIISHTTYIEMPFCIEQGPAPKLVGQTPVGDVTFRYGGTVPLEVWAVSESPLHYQWQALTGESWLDYPDAIDPDWELHYLHENWDGYTMRCKIWNNFGTVYSEPFTLRYDSGLVKSVALTSPGYDRTGAVYQPAAGEPLETKLGCMTEGVEIETVEWTGISPYGDGSTAKLVSTFPGQQPVLHVRVRFQPGVWVSEDFSGLTLDGRRYDASGNSSENGLVVEGQTLYGDYLWYFTTEKGARNAKIDLVNVRTRGSFAEGMVLTDMIEDHAGFAVPGDADARYEIVGTNWLCDGKPAELGDVILAGANYQVNVELAPADGWTFDLSSCGLMDGEKANDNRPGNGHLVLTRSYYVTDEDDADFQNWDVVVANQAKPCTENANDVLSDGGSVAYYWDGLKTPIDYVGLIGPTVRAGYMAGEILQEDVGCSDAYSTDWRYEIDAWDWTCDGQAMASDAYFQSGHRYEVQVLLVPDGGYKFVTGCDVFLNDSYIRGELQDDGTLLVRYSWDVNDSRNGIQSQSSQPKPKTRRVVQTREPEPETPGTLKLKGDYTGSETFLVNNEPGLVIFVEKDVTVKVTGGKSAFVLNADATITGPGCLTVIVDDAGSYLYGPAAIQVNGCKLTLDNARLKVRGCAGLRGKAENGTKARLDVRYSDVDADTKKGGLFDFFGNMTLTDVKIAAPTSGYLYGSTVGFYDNTADHNPVPRVVLRPQREVQSISIAEGSSITLAGGASKKLHAIVLPDDAANQEIVWKADNDRVRVSPDGTVTALRVGNAMVTATCSGKSASIGITVESNAVDVERIDILPHEITVGVGQTVAVRGIVTPGYASDVSGFWDTENQGIATVSPSSMDDLNAAPAVITGVAPGDTGVIMFSYGYADGAYCEVHVVENFVAAQGVSISGATSRTLREGETATLSAAVTPANAANKTPIWTSSDPEIVSVQQNGKITAEACGDAVITAEIWNGSAFVSASVEIHVPYPVYGVGLSGPKSLLYVGDTMQMEAAVYPSTAENHNVTWSSSNPAVATVDQNGLVTAVGVDGEGMGATGSATITIVTEDGGFTEDFGITVVTPPIHVTEITLDRSEITLPAFGSRRVYLTVGPENADNQAWTWESTDESVARVRGVESGDFTFGEFAEIDSDGDGKALVTFTTEDGSRTVRLRVTALKEDEYVPVQSVELPPEILVPLGGCVTIQPTIYPSNASEKTVLVTADQFDGVLRVEDGRVYGEQLGYGNITVQVGEQGTVTTIHVVQTADELTLSDSEIELAHGQTKQLTATLTPSSAYDKTITWTSSDENAVTVSDSGKLTAVGYGVAIVTARNDFTGLTSTCTVTVPNPVYELFVNGDQLSEATLADLPAGLAYDPAAKTLTISGDVTSDAEAPLIQSRIDGLTVKITGSPNLTSKQAAIMVEADTVFTGGKLTVKAPSASAIVVRYGAALTFRNTELTVSGLMDLMAVEANAKLTFENAAAKLDGLFGAVDGFGEIKLTGCYLSAPEAAQIKDGAVWDGEVLAHSVVITKGAAPVYYTVTFNANGHGTAPAAQTVEEGKTAAKPADPTADGWTFGGWFTEKECKTAYDFSTLVTANLTLYAKWTEKTPPAPTNPFSDVTNTAYYYDAVLWAVNHDPQITNGTSGTTFSPDKTCTRGQVATFLWRAKGCPEPETTVNPFTDVSSNQYYYKAVIWAFENKITTGTGATTFSPDKGCTRAQVVTFLWRTEGEPAPNSTVNPFSDVKAGAYYYNAVLWAVNHEPQITNGTSATTFSPDKTCTRGQIVTFLYRDLGNTGDGSVCCID